MSSDGGRLPSLDVTNKSVKEAYRAYTSWLRKSGVRLGAIAVWKKLGSKDFGPQIDEIEKQISSLGAILPVYLEAIIGLCAAELGEDQTPLEWWRVFAAERLKVTWFDLRINDVDYYSLEGEQWASYAANKILKMQFKVDRLLATQGVDQDECNNMEEEIATDEAETERRQVVFTTVGNNRLGAIKDPEGYNYGGSGDKVDEATQNVPLFSHRHYLDLNERRVLKERRERLKQWSPLPDQAHLKNLTDLVGDYAAVLDDVLHDVEVLRLSHHMLKHDLSSAGAGGGGGHGGIDKEEPAWWSKCDPAVYALAEKKGMKFESKGVTESAEQKSGRKVRDEIYERFAPLWDEQKYTWSKIPDDSKIAIANACGKAPIYWNPGLTARRMTTYILFRRSAKGQKQLQRQADAKAAATSTGKSKKVSHLTTKFTLCAHYAHIYTKCKWFITQCEHLHIM